jgi:hypothetical protein
MMDDSLRESLTVKAYSRPKTQQEWEDKVEGRLARLIGDLELAEAKEMVAELSESAQVAETADDLAEVLLGTELVQHALNQVDWDKQNPLSLDLNYKKDSLTLRDALQAMREV